MVNWFKRNDGGRVEAPARTQAAPRPRVTPRPEVEAVAPPLPEVVAEGNTQADWSAWEDSMTALDSQLQGLDPSSRIQVRDTGATPLEEADAFARLGRRRDL